MNRLSPSLRIYNSQRVLVKHKVHCSFLLCCKHLLSSQTVTVQSTHYGAVDLPIHGGQFLIHGLFGCPLVPWEIPAPTAWVGELTTIVLEEMLGEERGRGGGERGRRGGEEERGRRGEEGEGRGEGKAETFKKCMYAVWMPCMLYLAEKLIRPKIVATFKADQVEPMHTHFSKKVTHF